MTFVTRKSNIKTIKAGDALWSIKDGIMVTPRAGFEIKKECPNTYKDVVMECIDRGWLSPVAYMRDDEYAWETLKE